MNSQLITVENQSKNLSPKDLFNLVWAVNYQVLFHYGRSRWVEGGFASHGHLILLPSGVAPPSGAWNLIILDNSDQQGALGYHDDEQGNGIPYAEVFVQDSINDGVTVSSVASHEALEMLVDPWTNDARKALRNDTQQFYIVEVGDPVQGNDYDVGEPEGRQTGAMVSDFALPAWWKIENADVSGYSYRKSVSAPWQIAPQGYMSTAPVSDPNNWSQIYGEKAQHVPDSDSRPSRIIGKT